MECSSVHVLPKPTDVRMQTWRRALVVVELPV